MDFKTRDELLDFAQVLEGQTINKAIERISDKYNEQYLQDDEARIYKIEYKGKGAFGDYLEERYFHKKNDNESQPDFPELGIELKASPLKYLQSGELTVKERLVLNHFTFKDIVNEEFNTSKFVMKNSHILLVFYIWQKASRDFGKFTINLVDIWDVLERDRNQIEADWQYIVDKVKRGEAHLLSEGDTILLGAATKGATAESSMQTQPFSDIKARGRALCFKTAYIKSIYKTLLQERNLRKKEKSLQTGKEWHPLEVVLHERLDQFFGLSGRAISKMLGKTFNLRNKSRYAHLSRYMMGLSIKESDTYHELESGNIQIKAIRIEVDGKVKESMSFRNIYFKDIVNEDWEDSLFYEELTSKFIFMLFKKRFVEDDDYYFDGFMLWNMPLPDIEEAKSVWEDTKAKISIGDYEHFTKMTDHPIAHVRPKGTDATDLMETPQGTMEKKKSFWLRNTYIQDVVSKRESYKPIKA